MANKNKKCNICEVNKAEEELQVTLEVQFLGAESIGAECCRSCRDIILGKVYELFRMKPEDSRMRHAQSF